MAREYWAVQYFSKHLDLKVEKGSAGNEVDRLFLGSSLFQAGLLTKLLSPKDAKIAIVNLSIHHIAPMMETFEKKFPKLKTIVIDLRPSVFGNSLTYEKQAHLICDHFADHSDVWWKKVIGCGYYFNQIQGHFFDAVGKRFVPKKRRHFPSISTHKRNTLDVLRFWQTFKACQGQTCEENYARMKHILTDLFARGLNVVIVSPPIPPATLAMIDQRILGSHAHYLNAAMDGYPGLRYLSYHDKSYPEHLFKDALHMNKLGAAYFTRHLLEDVSALSLAKTHPSVKSICYRKDENCH